MNRHTRSRYSVCIGFGALQFISFFSTKSPQILTEIQSLLHERFATWGCAA